MENNENSISSQHQQPQRTKHSTRKQSKQKLILTTLNKHTQQHATQLQTKTQKAHANIKKQHNQQLKSIKQSTTNINTSNAETT